MVYSAELIILSCTKIGEKSLVAHTLSAEWGRRSFIVAASRENLALLLPLSIVEAEICPNRNSELWRARKLSSAYTLNGIRNDISRNSITLFMSEVLYRLIKDGAIEGGLYQWCRSSIITLDSMGENYANFHIRWLMELSVAMGFRPDSESLAPFAGTNYSLMQKMLENDWASAMLLPLNGTRRNELARSLIAYLSFHCECRLEIRSLDVLHALFR